MSILKNWKFLFAAMAVATFTACAGSSGSSDSSDNTSEAGAQAAQAAPKEKIDENKLKKTQEEAVAITEENHKLRKEIFDAKNKLGLSTATEESAAQ